MNRGFLKLSKGASKKYLSPLAVWALAFGCTVGWGAFVMPGTTLLPSAGSLGTSIGLLIGACIMLIIGVNYSHLIRDHADEGGSYSYVKNILGGDHGFLCGWMLLLTYIAIIWANATALSLLFRYLFGDVLCFGFSYTIADYTVWFGEFLLSLALISIAALICIFSKNLAKWVMIICAALLFLGVCVCFVATVVHNGGFSAMAPMFKSGQSPMIQVLEIVILGPWAFVGFESVSHSSAEFRFSNKKILPIIVAALITGLLTYVMLTVCGSMACPDGYANWEEYISALMSFDGVEGLPTFYNAQQAMGDTGLLILGISVFCGITSSLVGYYIALSRLIRAMAKDRMLPNTLAKRNKQGSPWVAILCIAAISCLIPLLGRTAIGWIVDVTTVGAVIVYGYISICSFIVGRREHRRPTMICGALGTVVSFVFAAWYLLPNLWTPSDLAGESYLILIGWSLLGMIVFRMLVQQDKTRRFGKSEIVWLILFVLILIVSVAWMHRTTVDEAAAATQDVRTIHEEAHERQGVSQENAAEIIANRAVTERIDDYSGLIVRNIFIQSALVLCSLVVIFSIFNLIKKREKDIEEERLRAEETSRAKTTFLSNMSHDIRTPMNAVTGYTKLALEEENLPDNVRTYLEKIDLGGKQLVSLINDILDMSRIESGKVELDVAPADLCRILDDVNNIFSLQMKTKGLTFIVDYSDVQTRYVFCDKIRLNRILMNLVSNAFKFTPEGGSISVVLRQTALEFGQATYELTVSDTGIGMSPEFKEHIFDAFERERTSTVSQLQGTGLGMSIAKSLIELMDGTIEVESEQNVGTTFLLTLNFSVAREEDVDCVPEIKEIQQAETEGKSGGNRLLIVEDNPINSEIASEILRRSGFETDTAENGKIAVEKISAADPDAYAVILMDIQMPVMDGYTAAKEIRALGGGYADLPIIALSANTFESDRKDALNAGMNDHVSKPFEPDVLIATIMKYIQ